MIDFSGQTKEAILAQMLALIPNTFDKRDTGPINTALAPAAYVLQLFYINLNTIQQQAFIGTATGSDLDSLAPLGGITRNQATYAVRQGTFDAPVPLGARFSTINGEDSIDFTVTSVTGGYQLTAETAGSIGNQYVGPILPISSIPGLTSASIGEILIPGEDEETDDDLRSRLIEALNSRPFGGNIAAYRQTILTMDGVGAVQVWPTWNGGGTVKCSILGADYAPASSELIQTVQNAIDPPTSGLGLGMAPIGAQVTIATGTSVSVNVTATIQLKAGYDLSQVQPLVEAAIADYIEEVEKTWGDMYGTTTVEYYCNVYASRVNAAIVGVEGVANVTDLTLNGSENDLILTETALVQEVPQMGTVTLNV